MSISVRAGLVQTAAAHVFREADCPEGLLGYLYTSEPEVALLAALHLQLWNMEWENPDHGVWPTLWQPGRMAYGCKEFGIGHDSEALRVWIDYARDHVDELKEAFYSQLAGGLTADLPKVRALLIKPRARWSGGAEI